MALVPLFLNELSYPLDACTDGEIDRTIIAWLSGIKAAQKHAEIALISEVALSQVRLTNHHLMLPAAISRINKEWWTFLRRIEQRSPFSRAERCIAPSGSFHIRESSLNGQALLWCTKNDAFITSFASNERWGDAEIAATVCDCLDELHKVELAASLRNIAAEEHVFRWIRELTEYGITLASSTIVFSNDGFVLRLFFNDHDPPHVHVFKPGNARCVGRIRFDVQPEVMEGAEFHGAFRREVIALITEKKEQLMQGWLRCREGLNPVMLSN